MRRSERKWCLVTANVTSWTKGDELLTECLQWQRIPDMVMLQELQRAPGTTEQLEAQLS